MPTLTPLQLDWKVGDKALFDCQEVIIDNFDEHGGSVRYGGIIMGFHTSRAHLFPVTPEGMNIARVFREMYDGLRKQPCATGLNHPAISEHVREMFNDTMTALHEEGPGAAADSLKLAMEFFNLTRTKLAQAAEITVNDVYLLRR
jgi:hypothetical protein